MKRQILAAVGLLTLSAAIAAAPIVNGNTISWPDDGWYQVQRVNEDVPGNINVCEGGLSCEVVQGEYIVINHTTGERFPGITVTQIASSKNITVAGNSISWPDDGWYQVQNDETFEQVCSGGRSCDVAPGTYIVINHTTGDRFEGIEVNVTIDPIIVSGATISWPDNGWYQVQAATSLVNICNGGSVCEVPPGSYVVINHSTGERFENIRVGSVSPNPSNIQFQEFISGDLAFTEDLTFNQPRFQVVRANEELNNLYFGALTGPICDACGVEPFFVDFTKYTVVLVAHEIVPSGGYDIRIERAVQGQDRLAIEVVNTSPGDNCPVDSAFTGPFKLYQLSGIFNEIDFVERTVQDAACE